MITTLLAILSLAGGTASDPPALVASGSPGALRDLPVASARALAGPGDDWLVRSSSSETSVFRSADGNDLILSNGLIARSWRLAPNAAAIAFDNLMTGASLLRGVKPEARLGIDGETYDVGGLLGQPNYAYLRREWIDALEADPAGFRFTGFEIGETAAPFPWKRVRHAEDRPWPAPGAALTLHFAPPPGVAPGLSVSVHYEMYDGIPLLAKWLTIRNDGDDAVHLHTLTTELLAVVEPESTVEDTPHWEYAPIHAESDYAFHGMDPRSANKAIRWVPDPQYLTQVSYRRKTPNLLVSGPPIGPDQIIEPGTTFASHRTFELVHDSTDRERQGLAVRRMYRTIAPWATENPILMHVRSADPDAVRLAVDQCASVGFEMVIMTFGSGFNIESEDPAYIARIRELVEYANARGVELGGYSLLASRRVSDEHDVINPETGKPGGAIFGNSPCLGSEWGEDHFRRLYAFIEATGLRLLEHDGSYPGDVCASEDHPGHRGLGDSQWTQWRTITDFYKWCRGRGVYLNVPDHYFLSGSSKTGMGYRETNWSLPRAQQIIHGRQNIFDGTWLKTPSMGWMFVPLVEYHGGGAAATLEPLAEHLDAYAAHLANNFGAGVQACYRGPRLYDTDETKAVLEHWVGFYRTYRDILDSDVVHVRRADGRDLDCILHVNPRLERRGLAVIYNPLDRRVQRSLTLPLYYTGLTDAAMIREREGASRRVTLDRRSRLTLEVDVDPRGVTWFVIEPPR